MINISSFKLKEKQRNCYSCFTEEEIVALLWPKSLGKILVARWEEPH